jgi:hypothetical protein
LAHSVAIGVGGFHGLPKSKAKRIGFGDHISPHQADIPGFRTQPALMDDSQPESANEWVKPLSTPRLG